MTLVEQKIFPSVWCSERMTAARLPALAARLIKDAGAFPADYDDDRNSPATELPEPEGE